MRGSSVLTPPANRISSPLATPQTAPYRPTLDQSILHVANRTLSPPQHIGRWRTLECDSSAFRIADRIWRRLQLRSGSASVRRLDGAEPRREPVSSARSSTG